MSGGPQCASTALLSGADLDNGEMLSVAHDQNKGNPAHRHATGRVCHPPAEVLGTVHSSDGAGRSDSSPPLHLIVLPNSVGHQHGEQVA
ncbi:MAG: hypothetical protein ACO4CU_14005, partial [Ilumatobacteraceae bacterium]